MTLKTLFLKLVVLAGIASTFGLQSANAAPNYRLPVLAYHDVVLAPSLKDEPQTVSVDSLVRQFSEIQAKGFVPVTLEQVYAASKGEGPLPDKAILLTFDDGYRSFYTHVLPLLRAYRWPATLAIIGTRVDSVSQPNEPDYLTTAQLREIVASGLVELANHSHDLHHGIPANPWGNTQPAAVTRGWTAQGTESDDQWLARVKLDLARTQVRIFDLTGKKPLAMVWPYGRYNEKLQNAAKPLGIKLFFTLEDGVSDVRYDRLAIKRYLIGRSDRAGFLGALVSNNESWRPTIRAVQLHAQDYLPTGEGKAEDALSGMLNVLVGLQGSVAIIDPFVREKGVVVRAAFPTKSIDPAVNYGNRMAALLTGKIGYASWLSVPLSVARYKGLTQEQVLDLVEDAAKSMAVSGLVVEDAGQVDEQVIVSALNRVRAWRGDAVLALGYKGTRLASEVLSTITTTGAKYVLMPDAEVSQAQIASAAVIHSFAPNAVGQAQASAQKGFAHIAIEGIPAVAKDWFDVFSLRSQPQRRVPGAD